MKITDLITEQTKGRIDYEKRMSFVTGWLIAKYDDILENLPGEWIIYYNGIDCRPSSREECIQQLQAFGGKWDKEPEEYYKDKIRYSRSIEHNLGSAFNLFIVISQAPPPASCRIEEVEELVPASVRKVKKMVCSKVQPSDEPVEIVEPVTEESTINEEKLTV
jgi:hypothetical protein